MERRGRVTESGSTWVNWQQEEPDDLGGRRRPSTGGTSRVTGDGQARICERLGAKFPGPTRRQETGPSQTGLRWRGESQVDYPPGDYSYCACSRLYSPLHSLPRSGPVDRARFVLRNLPSQSKIIPCPLTIETVPQTWRSLRRHMLHRRYSREFSKAPPCGLGLRVSS